MAKVSLSVPPKANRTNGRKTHEDIRINIGLWYRRNGPQSHGNEYVVVVVIELERRCVILMQQPLRFAKPLEDR